MDNTNKKLFYFQFKDNFFESEEAKTIELIADDLNYNFNDLMILWLKLIAKALSHDGYIERNGGLPVTPRFLKSILSFKVNNDVEIINQFIKALSEEKLIIILKNGSLFIPLVKKITMNKKESSEAIKEWRLKKMILDKEIEKQDINVNEEFELFFNKIFSGLMFKGYCVKENEEAFKLMLKDLFAEYKDQHLINACNDFIENKLLTLDVRIIQDKVNYMKQTIINFMKDNKEVYIVQETMNKKYSPEELDELNAVANFKWMEY